MPQTKEAKRKTAVRLYGEALAMHHNAIATCSATKVDMHRRKARNLEKHITDTLAKR